MANSRRSQQREGPAAPPLAIRVLGELAVERDGETLLLPPSKKTRALLAYLLLDPREHTREALCSLFWDAPDDLRGALRWSLSRLRPLVDGPNRRLIADRERVRLEATGASVDLQRVRALCGKGLAQATRAQLEEAAALFRGELLEGLELSEAFRFQAFCTSEREAARRLRGQVLRTLCARLEAEPEEALPVARQMVSLDPSDEPAHRKVMSLLVALGRPREALAQYDVCRSALRANFGAAPSAETEALRRTLGAPPAPATSLPPEAPARAAARPGPAPALVEGLAGAAAIRAAPPSGRAVELAALEAALDGRGQGLLLLLGEPGMGKSRLLEALAEAARARGVRVLSGRSYEAEQVRPYGCLLDALGGGGLLPGAAGASSPSGSDLGALVAAPGSPGGDLGRERLFDAVAALVREAAGKGPLLLLLDDAHWIDEASAALTHFLLRTAGGAGPSPIGPPKAAPRNLPQPRGLTVVVAARSGELADNPQALRLMRTLRRDRLLRELHLAPLAPEAVAELLAARGLAVDAARVHRESGGNPLLALELGRALAEGTAWGGGLAEALEQRFAALDAGLQALLEWPAALGRGMAPALLGRLTARPLPEILAGLEALERHGLFRGVAGAESDFAHDLLREAALRRLSPGRRRALHAALARTLWDDCPPEQRGSVAGTVARQALSAGDDLLAVRASVSAARQALRVFAHDEARALVERALPLLPSLGREERLRAQLALLDVAVLVRRPGTLPRLVEELSRLVLEGEASGLADVVADAFYLLSKAHYDGENEVAAVRGSIAGADAARQSPDPLVRARALAQAGRCLAQAERDVGRAGTLLDDAAVAASEARAFVIDVALGRGLVHAFRAEDALAEVQLSQAARAAREAGDHWREVEALFVLCRSALERGDAAAALRFAGEAEPVAAKMPEGSEPALARALLALARLLDAEERGQPDPAAEALLRRGCAELRAGEARWRLSQVLQLRAEQEQRAGRPAAALALVEEARALGRPQSAQMRHGRAHLILAELALGRGDHALARAELSRALAAPGELTARLRLRLAAVAAAIPAERTVESAVPAI